MKNRLITLVLLPLVLLLCASATAQAQAQTSIVFGPENFTRDAGQPRVTTRTFSVQDPSQNYTLLIRSGMGDENRVASATITINGVQVTSPSDFNQQTGFIIKPLNLQQQNSISVELRGQPGSFLTVTIRQGAPPPTTRFTIIDNRNDPLVLQAETSDGEIIQYFGDKDGDGIVTSLYALRIQNSIGEVTTVFLDERLRPVEIEAANGVFFEINWLTQTSAALTATAPNGDQIDIPVDLATQTAGLPTLLPRTVNALARSGYQGAQFFNANAMLRLARTQVQAKTLGTSTVSVRRCGVPVNNASVKLSVFDKKGFGPTYVYNRTGNGVYTLPVPAPDPGADRRAGDRLCFAIAKVLAGLCTAVNNADPVSLRVMCPLLTLGATLLGVPPNLFFFACNVTVLALEDLCKVTSLQPGSGPSLGGGSTDTVDNIAAYLCQFSQFVTNRITHGQPTYTITATMPGVAGQQTAILDQPIKGTFPPVTIQFPCQCDVGYGKKLIVGDNNTDVKVTILPFEADFTDEIWLFNSGRTRFIGTNREVGKTVDLGRFNAGEELIFGIRVRETGKTFLMGPGFRNPDRYAHDKVTCLSDGVRVAFEDNLGLGDQDFDDAVIKVVLTR